MTQQVQADTSKTAVFSDDYIVRGLSWHVSDSKWDLAQKIAQHTITAQEIVKAVEPLGVWWGIPSQYGGLSAAQSHAEVSDDTVLKMLAEAAEEDPENPRTRWFGADVPLIVVAKRPKFLWPMEGGRPAPDAKPTPWDPALMNPATGFTGNSYLQDGTRLEIVEVHYDAGDGYRVLRAGGLQTTASLEEDGRVGAQKTAATFEHSETSRGYIVRAKDGDKQVGEMLVRKEDGLIEGIEVQEEHRRKGFGRGMFDYAKGKGWKPKHETRPEHLSPEGREFAKRVAASPGWWFRATGSTKSYYHVSGESNRASIEQHGLRAGDGGVWLYSDPERVRGIGKVWTPGHAFEQQDVWEVDPTDVVHGTEARDPISAEEWYPNDPVWVTYSDVPPERVRRVDNDTLRATGSLKTAATPGRWFHIADKADFRLNPRKQPELNRTLPAVLKPGIFLTQFPEKWGGDYGYRRPFIVEFDVPGDVVAGSIEGTNEMYVPAEFYDRMRIVKVHTWDGFSRDRWHEPGPVEEMTGINHVTGEPLKSKGFRPMSRDPWFESPGPGVDARQIQPDLLRQYVADFKKWRRTQPKGFMLSSKTSAASGTVTFWHLTRDPNFVPDPNFRPRGPNGKPGQKFLSLSADPLAWLEKLGDPWFEGATLYAAEVELPADQQNLTWAMVTYMGLTEYRAWGESVERAKVRRVIPVSQLRSMASKTALPSWRDRGARPQAEGVIVPDKGRMTSYEVFLYGQPFARRSSLQEAKAAVEEIYGKVTWTRVPGDKDPHNDPVWGYTTMFNDAEYYLVCERLPRLGVTAAEEWRPTKGMFAPGKDTLDDRIFDLDTEMMIPSLRDDILATLAAYWDPKYPNWRTWARVYLAGSGASYWWDSDADLDILIGVDLDILRIDRPANVEVSDEDVLGALNRGLQRDLRPTTTDFHGFTATWFVNAGAYDIRAIHPYAAYDVTLDEWVVRPPALPATWGPDDIPDSTWERCEQAALNAMDILDLPEPERTEAGTIYFDWLHEGRRAAYSAYGGGWLDPGNVIYQYLTQHPEGLLRKLYLCKHPEEASIAEAIEKAATFIPGNGRDLGREVGPVRQVAKPMSLDEATALTRKILTRAGFPGGDQAVAEDHPSGYGKSSVAWYMDTVPPTPVVALARDMQNEFTTIHECAHILRNGPSAAGKSTRQVDHEAHDQEFFRVFLLLMRQYASPECLKRFETIFGTRDFMASKKTAGMADYAWGVGFDKWSGSMPFDGGQVWTNNPREKYKWDTALVLEAVRRPNMQWADPRKMRASQGGVTRQGVRYYMSEEYKRTGLTYADRDQAGNRVPVLARFPDGTLLILSGHHRAVAALLAGEMLHANVFDQPWIDPNWDPRNNRWIRPQASRAGDPDALRGLGSGVRRASEHGQAGGEADRGRGDRRAARGSVARGGEGGGDVLEVVEGGQPEGDRGAAVPVTASLQPRTLWHVTRNRNFVPDREFKPGGGNGEVGIFGAGLFLTPNPELWRYLWYPTGTAYAAEITAPGAYQVGMPDRDQWFVEAKDFDSVKVKRIVPLDQAVKEALGQGYGFAMLALDAIERSRICIIDHQQGWGEPFALCDRVTDGNPLKWTTLTDALTGQLSNRLCEDCKVEARKRTPGGRLSSLAMKPVDLDDEKPSVCVVALPDNADQVHRIGPEEKHATLLFLGDLETLPEDATDVLAEALAKIAAETPVFIEEVTDVHPLGDEGAQVWGLNGSVLPELRERLIAADERIEGYLENATQYPDYTPHTTIGYPEGNAEDEAVLERAKQVDQIRYDRLGLWIGDERHEYSLWGAQTRDDPANRTAGRSRGLNYDQAWDANKPEFWVVGNAEPMIGGDWAGHVTLVRRSMGYAEALNPGAFVEQMMMEASARVRSGDVMTRGGKPVTTLYLVVRGRGREGMNSGGASWVVAEAPAAGGALQATRKSLQGEYGRAASANARMLQALTYASGEEARKWIGENVAGVVTDESMFDAVPQKVTVYRGISLKPGQDPWSSVNDAGGVGSSWTISEETARAIAERGMAGFTSGGQVVGDTYSVAKDKPYVPTILRAEVTLLPPEQNGPAPYRPWTIDYASEAEIDIPRGTEIVLNGYTQAEMQVRRPDPSNPEYFNLVTWRWGSGWKSGKVKRTAAATLSSTWYHGCSLRRAQEVASAGRFRGDYRANTNNWGVGVYLTTSLETAHRYAGHTSSGPGAVLTVKPQPSRVFETTSLDLQRGVAELAGFPKIREGEELTQVLKEHGYDALLVHFNRESWLILFDPTDATYGSHEEQSRDMAQMVAGLKGDLPEGIFVQEVPYEDAVKKRGSGQVEYRHTPPRDPYAEPGEKPSGFHTIRAFVDGKQIGSLSWYDPGTGEYARLNPEISAAHTKIDKVEVASDHRRKGIATEMLRRAREITPGVKHSDELTSDGRAWRNAVSPGESMNPARPARMNNRLGAVEEKATHAGIVIQAEDTGRILMQQRTWDEEDAPRDRGTWEWPGGSIDEGESPILAAWREFEEESGLPRPEKAVLVDSWLSNGVYRAFLYRVPSEGDVGPLNPDAEAAVGINPDDSERATPDVTAWFSLKHINDMGKALRPAVRRGTPWDTFRKGLTAKTGGRFLDYVLAAEMTCSGCGEKYTIEEGDLHDHWTEADA